MRSPGPALILRRPLRRNRVPALVLVYDVQPISPRCRGFGRAWPAALPGPLPQPPRSGARNDRAGINRMVRPWQKARLSRKINIFMDLSPKILLEARLFFKCSMTALLLANPLWKRATRPWDAPKGFSFHSMSFGVS